MIEVLKAFLLGGLICVIGQLLIDLTKLTPARIMVCYVVTELYWAFSVCISFWLNGEERGQPYL